MINARPIEVLSPMKLPSGPNTILPPPVRIANTPPLTPKNASDSAITQIKRFTRSRLCINSSVIKLVRLIFHQRLHSIAASAGNSAIAVVSAVQTKNMTQTIVTGVQIMRFLSRENTTASSSVAPTIVEKWKSYAADHVSR